MHMIAHMMNNIKITLKSWDYLHDSLFRIGTLTYDVDASSSALFSLTFLCVTLLYVDRSNLFSISCAFSNVFSVCAHKLIFFSTIGHGKATANSNAYHGDV